MSTTPTVVVGVGKAGIDVLSAVHALAEANDDASEFEFVGIDSDPTTLERTPPGTTEVYLSVDRMAIREEVAEYPYLTDDTDVPPEGAGRHRGVGRYKLDARWSHRYVPGFPAHYAALRDAISEHFEERCSALTRQATEFNVFHVHALGGGTGSGTFPLVAGMIERVVDGLESQQVHTAGVGVVPNIPWMDENDPAFPGPAESYLNAYAALADLKQFERLAFDPEVELEVPVYANQGAAPGIDPNVKSFTFEGAPPFDDYWLVGIDEAALTEGSGSPAGPESEREAATQTTARALHALTQETGQRGPWQPSQPVVGTFDRGTVSVPHRTVVAYCELQAELSEKGARESEIAAKIETARSRRERLRELQAESADAVGDEVTRTAVERQLEAAIGSDRDLIETGSETEVETVLDELEDEFGVEGALVATALLRERLEVDEDHAPVEDAWWETVERLRSKYASWESPASRAGLAELERRASEIAGRIDERIDECDDVVTEWNPGVVGTIRDVSPPVASPFESEREAAKRRLSELRDDRAELEQVLSTVRRVDAMERAVDDRRQRLRSRVRKRLEENDEEISSLRAERRAIRTEVDEIRRAIDSIRDDLTEPRLGRAATVLPLRADALEELDVEFVEAELDSLAAYVEHDLVDEDKVRIALSQKFDVARAWENRIIDRDMEDVTYERYHPDRDEMWILYHRDNETLVDRADLTSPMNVARSGEGLRYRTDRYSVEFVSFSKRGPVSGLVVYQRLEEMADRGALDDLAGGTDTYEDYREAFAYPEWYGRWLTPFDGEPVTLPFPPELDLNRIDRPSLGEGELKNSVRTTGLEAYLWNGVTWEHYESDGDGFTGWRETLRRHAVSFRDLQQSAPDPELTAQWLAGMADWAELVDDYRENLVDESGFELEWESPR